MKIEGGGEYASIHRRVIAATVDALVMMLLLGSISEITASIFVGNSAEVLMKQFMGQVEGQESGFLSGVTAIFQFLKNNHLLFRLFMMHLFSFACAGFYHVTFWCWRGASIGKILLRIQVVDAVTLGPLSRKQAIARFFSYFPSSLPLFLGFLMIDFNKRRRGLHDFIAGTVVIVNKW